MLIYPETSAPASVISLASSRISSELNAVITEFPVKVADVIEVDTVLARLNCTDYELRAKELAARLAAISARVDFADKQFKRAQSLRRQNTLSQELVEQRESDLSNLRAERNASKVALQVVENSRSKCVIRAPFHAAIIERNASVGEYVTPGTPLLRIVALDAIEVSARVLARDVNALKQAKELVLRYQAYDYPLELRAISPVIDAVRRDQEARLLFTNDKAPAGASGRLVWSNGAAIAPELLVRRGQKIGVLLAINGRATFHALPGAQEGRPARIDLFPDTLIITDGRLGLSDGAAITIRP